jgi:hypothetical protein
MGGEAMNKREAPRISVNKLGEYVIARPQRRRAIIAEQKDPKNYVVPRYRAAQDAIVEYLVTRSERDLMVARRRLASAGPKSPWDAQRRKLCIEAIGAFIEVFDAVDLDDFVCTQGPRKPNPLVIRGVDVSVRPEVIIKDSKGMGGLKLYFGKNTRLGEAGPYVATTVHQYLQGIAEESPARLCLVIDVFARQVVTASSATRRLRGDVGAACGEIADRWDDI